MAKLNSFSLPVLLGIVLTNLPLTPHASGQEANPAGTQANFQIVQSNKSVPIIFDQKAADVIEISANALAKDIELITGTKPIVTNKLKSDSKTAIIVGTLGNSVAIDQLVKSGKISKDGIAGKWESFLIQTVDSPSAGIDKALVIAGSDSRGTAFGVFELSKRLGVSPWVWWADVNPAKQDELQIALDDVVMGPPSVKFRGIFLNDEDWALKPWAAKNIDTDVKDIGPKTYAQIFELMLRLKANYIWPAMHPCTKAFFYYPENVKVAEQYNIVLGSSHCEPMLRNNVDEWKKNFKNEYEKKPGPWRYDTNKEEIHRYWEDRVKESANVDAVYTIGMRGVHDGGMPGPKTTEGQVKLLNEVIKDQREMFAKHLGKDPAEIPQIFCPYKEVLKLYQSGAEIPDDVTLVWADDNHGYIRNLSTPEEQKRSGGSGVYYHLSYWGVPKDYLWLSTIAPPLISYELSKAYAYGADRLWVMNVGDIKPAELETEFAMDLAWDVNAWPPEKSHEYAKQWAARTFGKEYAEEIADIKDVYYKLAIAAKPEHMDSVPFSSEEMNTRLAEYKEVAEKASALKAKIPAHLQDAYYQLILYPVLGSWKMNEKQLYTRMGEDDKAMAAYKEIIAYTEVYNKEISNGKWDRMMSMIPRNRPVFKAPKKMDKKSVEKYLLTDKPIKTIAVSDLQFDSKEMHIIPGLGVDGASLTRKEFVSESYQQADAAKAPTASCKIKLPKGKYRIELVCVPTHAIHEGRNLTIALKINDEDSQFLDINSPAKSDAWYKNVLRGFSAADAKYELKEDGYLNLQLGLLDPGLAISKIVIY